jgi:hypothetical protein
MPLWLSPTMLNALDSTGMSRIGKLTLIKLGWSYHQLLEKGSGGQAGTLRAVPVLVITRTDTGDRYWVAPNGANPMILRAERKSGRFFLATVQTDPIPSSRSRERPPKRGAAPSASEASEFTREVQGRALREWLNGGDALRFGGKAREIGGGFGSNAAIDVESAGGLGTTIEPTENRSREAP